MAEGAIEHSLAERHGKTLIAFDATSPRASILIDVLAREHLTRLARLFRSLSSGAALRIALHNEDFLLLDGIDSFVLDATAEEGEPAKTLARYGNNVYWTRSRDGWGDCLAATEALEQSSTTAARQLSDSPADDATIELRFTVTEAQSTA